VCRHLQATRLRKKWITIFKRLGVTQEMVLLWFHWLYIYKKLLLSEKTYSKWHGNDNLERLHAKNSSLLITIPFGRLQHSPPGLQSSHVNSLVKFHYWDYWIAIFILLCSICFFQYLIQFFVVSPPSIFVRSFRICAVPAHVSIAKILGLSNRLFEKWKYWIRVELIPRTFD